MAHRAFFGFFSYDVLLTAASGSSILQKKENIQCSLRSGMHCSSGNKIIEFTHIERPCQFFRYNMVSSE